VFNPVKEPEFKEGEFTVYVYPVDTSDLDASGMSYTFIINYFIGSHHIPLLNDQPTLGLLYNKEKVNYYIYAYRAKAEEIRLTITKMNGNVEAIVSLNQEITFPTWDDVNSEDGVFRTSLEKNTFSSTKIRNF
jgi:hypothetical protein